MRVWNDLNGDSSPYRGGTLTIGKFDGLHLGHQELLQRVQKGPQPSVVVTFDPHPLQVLKPELGLTKIFPKADLIEQLPCYGPALLVILPFSQALGKLTAAEFAERYFAPFAPSEIVVGYDFAFGRGREGNLEWLQKWCGEKKIRFTVVAARMVDGAPVSSGRVRDLIRAGDVEQARRLLLRAFYIRGEVVAGAGRGRTIGVPTLNQMVENETLPALGVYATRTKVSGQVLASVTNVGVAPTFVDQSRVHVETHLIGVTRDAYGEKVDVEFIRRLRPEKKFPSVGDLKKQIEQDILMAERELAADEKMDVHKPHK